MIRKTLTMLSLLGLLLSVGLWGVSYFPVGYVFQSQQFPDFGVVNGLLTISKVPMVAQSPGVQYGNKQVSGTLWWPPVGSSFWSSNVLGWSFLLPLWMPTLLFGSAIVSCSLARRRSRRIRKKLGLCLHCGYVLRGSEGSCPECGTAQDARTLVLRHLMASTRPHVPPPQTYGLCVKCGCELRASKDRCPECGTEIAKQG